MAEQGNSLNDNDGKGISYADKRRAERKAALSEYIEGQRYIQAINADLNRDDITAEELPVIKFKTETRLKLLSKVLPDVKAVEHSGNPDQPLTLVLSSSDAGL